MTEFYMRYVPHERAARFTALGWIDCGFSPGHHGCHSRLMKWNGADPPDPEVVDAIRSACLAEEGAA